MGLPIDPANASSTGCAVDAFDQRPANACATLIVTGEEVLEVANALNPGGAAVVEVVDQTDNGAFAFGDQCEDRIFVVEEPRPGGASDLERQGGFAGSTIEGVVAVPEREPGIEVGRADCANAGCC